MSRAVPKWPLGEDAGAPAILGLDADDRIAVPQGSWAYADPARRVAAPLVGVLLPGPIWAELGIPQQSLINHALSRPSLHPAVGPTSPAAGGEARRFEQNSRPHSGSPRTGGGRRGGRDRLPTSSTVDRVR